MTTDWNGNEDGQPLSAYLLANGDLSSGSHIHSLEKTKPIINLKLKLKTDKYRGEITLKRTETESETIEWIILRVEIQFAPPRCTQRDGHRRIEGLSGLNYNCGSFFMLR